MTTLFNGGPVMGGTFPALIWASVMSAWEEIQADHAAEKKAREEGREATTSDSSGETETYVPPVRNRSGAGRRRRSKRRRKPKPRPKSKRRRKKRRPKPHLKRRRNRGGGGGVTAG